MFGKKAEKKDIPPPNEDMNIFIIIDKEKLPEELRDKFPKDLLEHIKSALNEKNRPEIRENMEPEIPKDNNEKEVKSSKLFVMQEGRVIGNINNNQNL